MSETVSDLLLEKYANGELAGEQRQALERQIQQDEGLRRRYEALLASNEEILERYPPGPAAAQIEEAMARGPQTRRPPRLWAAWVLVPMAGALMLMVLPTTSKHQKEDPGLVRIKGTARLRVLRAEPDRLVPLASGDRARAGDVLQLQYVAGDQRYGVIASVDGRGEVTVHLADGPRAMALKAGGAVPLDHAYELDDAPVREAFVLATSREPFSLAEVVDNLGGELEGLQARLAPGIAVSTLELVKVP